MKTVRCRLCENERFDCVEQSQEFREHLRVHNVWEYLPPSTTTGKYVYLGAYVGNGYVEIDDRTGKRYDGR